MKRKEKLPALIWSMCINYLPDLLSDPKDVIRYLSSSIETCYITGPVFAGKNYDYTFTWKFQHLSPLVEKLKTAVN